MRPRSVALHADRFLMWDFVARYRFCQGAGSFASTSTVASTQPLSFRASLASRRVLLVAGGISAGRVEVAAAAALALARTSTTLLVDADSPAHGLSEALDTCLQCMEPAPLKPSGASERDIVTPSEVANLSAAVLSRRQTRSFLTDVLSVDKWKSFIEEDAGARLARAVGVPIVELLAVLDCLRPPPGAEMPVALAQLLNHESSKQSAHVVVDAGAAALAAQLQTVPPAVADGLDGLLKFQSIIKEARKAVVPMPVSAGLGLLIGGRKTNWITEYDAMIERLLDLRNSMSALALEDKAVLLALPSHPGRADEQTARRLIEYLQPICVALTGYTGRHANLAPRPEWVPPGPAVVTLPWVEGRPSGFHELSALADAMLVHGTGNAD